MCCDGSQSQLRKTLLLKTEQLALQRKFPANSVRFRPLGPKDGLGFRDQNLELGNQVYSKLCRLDRDGDGGGNCYEYGQLLEQSGDKRKALEVQKRECDVRENKVACAASFRLAGKKPTDHWQGLYESEWGLLWVVETENKKLKFDMSSAVGVSFCNWVGLGRAQGDKIELEPDDEYPNCKPTLYKKGENIVLEDPESKCQKLRCDYQGVFADVFRKPSFVP